MKENSAVEAIEFKYKWHDHTGAATGFATGSGSFNGSVLSIGNEKFAIADIKSLLVDQYVFMFGINVDDGLRTMNVEIYGTDIAVLANAINAARSNILAHQERVRLTKSGGLVDYRDQICPCCQSTIVLTGLPATPQIYCQYCDTLVTVDHETEDAIERDFRICEKCGMYSRPRKFAVFYFYFLFVTFGFHYNHVVRCSGCMRSSAWKMVGGNLFGLLGLPFALLQLYRSYSTKSIAGRFEGLDTANVLARRGKLDSALDRYDEVMDRVPENAGIKYNIGLGLMVKNDFSHAQELFELSLDDCSNYWPAVNGLMKSLQMQGKSEELKAAYRIWGRPE